MQQCKCFLRFFHCFDFFFFLPTKLSDFLKGHVYSLQTIWGKKVWKAWWSQSPSPMTSVAWVWVTIRKAWPVLCFSPGHGHGCQGTAPLWKAPGDSALRAWTPLLGIRLTFALRGIFAWIHYSPKCFLSLSVSSSPSSTWEANTCDTKRWDKRCP